MSIYEYDQEKHMRQEREAAWEDGVEDGKEQHLREQIRKKLAKGKSVPEIADALEETEETIREQISKMTPELLIWVNEKNEIIGYGEKLDTHIRGQLHRAFSIFIYDPVRKKLLLQKRASGKYHSGGLWSNSCCSHPRKDETWREALSRCLREELGVEITTTDMPLSGEYPEAFSPAGEFQYYSDYGDLAEHEWDYVFLCRHAFANYEIRLNKEEAEAYVWISPDDLDTWLKEHPEDFTSWFAPAYRLAAASIS